MPENFPRNVSSESETPRAKRPLWQRVLGVQPRRGRFVKLTFTLRGWITLLLVVIVVGGIGFAEYSMQPEFCRSCHIMEPYFQAWHQSTHKNVPCVDCHFEPGLEKTLYGKWQATSQAVKYMTETYGSKPHAEIRDASCLRSGCHEHRLLEGLSEWEVATQRGQTIKIHFDHAPHLKELRRGKQLRCVSCHSQIVQGQHITVTLDTCFTCHFKGVKHGRDDETLGGCGSCHGAPKGEIHMPTGVFRHADFLDRGVTCENCHAEAIKGDGAVPRQQCWSCHNQPQQLNRYGETAFIHQTHVTDHKVECTHCHLQIEHHLTAGIPPEHRLARDFRVAEESGQCGQCHEMTHNGPQQLYQGVGARGVPDMPSPMFRAQVDCIACHREREVSGEAASILGQTYVAAQQRCDYCHGIQYRGVLDNWKGSIDAVTADAEAALTRAEAAMAAASLDGPDKLDAQRLLDDARHNVRMVVLGRGVHNVIYATAALNAAIDNCSQVVAMCGGKPLASRAP